MRYFLDSNVVSALRVRGRSRPVEVWGASVPVGDLFVSAFTIAEIERGVVAKERSDAEQGAVLRRWFEENVLPTFADTVLPFDLSAARILAAYRVPQHAPFDDALIAAVAESAAMTIATRTPGGRSRAAWSTVRRARELRGWWHQSSHCRTPPCLLVADARELSQDGAPQIAHPVEQQLTLVA